MIYFRKAETATTFQELIILGYTLLLDRYYHKFVKTYSDAEFTKEQCYPARRSFYDLYEIATTYFPNTTKEQLADFLLNSGKFAYFICPDIEKLVFPGTTEGYQVDPLQTDFVGVDGLCYNDVLELSKNNK